MSAIEQDLLVKLSRMCSLDFISFTQYMNVQVEQISTWQEVQNFMNQIHIRYAIISLSQETILSEAADNPHK